MPDEDINLKLVCTVGERPPLYISFLFALQVLMANMMSPIGAVYFIHGHICAGDNQLVFAELLSTTFFMMGICTFLQTTFGIRLPILQGSAYGFLAPIAAMMSSSQWKCPVLCGQNETLQNFLESNNASISEACEDEPWIARINQISGSLACASLMQMFLGFSGLVGYLMNYIGPFTIVPTVTLIGLSMTGFIADTVKYHLGISFMFLALYFIFAIVLSRVTIPLSNWSKSEGCVTKPYPIFRLFPMLLSTLITWLFCFILTTTNVFPSDPAVSGYMARTDIKLDVTHKAKWFFIPYPGRTGIPTVGAGIFVGMLAATVASIIELIGDYYATAKICQVRSPPKHAINRAVTIEGFGGVLNGLLGAMHATTSYSGVVGGIGITGMASRFCLQLTACLFLLFGIIGKVGAFLSIIPKPIIGGALISVIGVVFAVGLIPLKYLELRSPRTMMILGTTILLGLVLPTYVRKNPDAIRSGNDTLDQVIILFLSTPICVGGVIGFLLDNIIPGTLEERGIVGLTTDSGDSSFEPDPDSIEDVYDLPLISDWLKRLICCTFLPILPSYRERSLCPSLRISNCKKDVENSSSEIATSRNDVENSTAEVATSLRNLRRKNDVENSTAEVATTSQLLLE